MRSGLASYTNSALHVRAAAQGAASDSGASARLGPATSAFEPADSAKRMALPSVAGLPHPRTPEGTGGAPAGAADQTGEPALWTTPGSGPREGRARGGGQGGGARRLCQTPGAAQTTTKQTHRTRRVRATGDGGGAPSGQGRGTRADEVALD